MITSNGDGEIEPGLTELVLGKACISSRVILVYRLNLQRITLQFVSARRKTVKQIIGHLYANHTKLLPYRLYEKRHN